jgi:hypothetical protein
MKPAYAAYKINGHELRSIYVSTSPGLSLCAWSKQNENTNSLPLQKMMDDVTKEVAAEVENDE